MKTSIAGLLASVRLSHARPSLNKTLANAKGTLNLPLTSFISLTSPSFGFVMYYSPAAAENCIRGFFHLGFQASYAQKSRNSRLKDLEDRNSTNIYCTGVPIEWNESVCTLFSSL
jgi:hypothetical protein